MTQEVPTQDEGIVNDVITSIMTPGYTANRIIRIMNYAFYGLFITLLSLLYLSGGNIHVLALFLLSVCLFVTITWFLGEIERQKEEEKSKQQ